MPVLGVVRAAGINDPGYRSRVHLSSMSLRFCKSARVSRTLAASAATSESYSSANAHTISFNVRPSQRARISCAVSFNSTMPSGKSKTLLPVAESLCNRTPFARRGCAASAISGIGMMDRIEDGPEHVAFKLECLHGLSLELRCVAVFQRNRERFMRIPLCLSDPAAEIVQPTRIDPRVKFFKGRKSCPHQIRSEKLGEG